MPIPHLPTVFRSSALLILLTIALTPLAVVAQSPEALTPEEQILADASARLAETQSISFTLGIEGETFVDDDHTLQLLEAKGVLVRPDRVQTDFKLKVLGTVTVSTSMIIVGEDRWSTDIITGAWGDAPAEFGYDPGILFDNQDGIGPVMDRVQNPVLAEDEKIRDRDCYHITAQVTPEIIDELTSGTMTGNPITVDLWIDKETSDVLRVRLAEPDTVTDREPATWTVDISDQDAKFTIEPPV